MKHVLIILLSMPILAHSQRFNKTIYRAYLAQDLALWEESLADYSGDKNSEEYRLAQYGLIAFYLDKEKNSKAEQLIAQLDKSLKKQIKAKPNASLWALRASLVGFRISLAPYKAPFIGGEVGTYFDEAKKLNARSPIYLCENANSLFYRPSIFGGSKTEAIKYFLEASRLLEQQQADKDNWYYINALSTLGQAYEKTNQIEKAREVFEKILQLAPDFQWLKEQHFPSFEKKHPKSN